MPSVPKREELYRIVWERTRQGAAEHFGLSWASVKELCRCLDVPLCKPGQEIPTVRGRLVLPPLPPTKYEVEEEAEARRVRDETAARTSRGIELLRAAGDGSDPTDPEKMHPLVVQAAIALRRQKPSHDGYVMVQDRKCLDIRVSPDSLERALAIMSAVLKGLEAVGCKVEVTAPEVAKDDGRARRSTVTRATVTRAIVDGKWFAFGLQEGRRAVPRPPKPKLAEGDRIWWYNWQWPRAEWRPDGKLSLTIANAGGARRVWQDGKDPLEDLIPSFVEGLGRAARRIDANRHRDEQREQARLEREREEEAARQERARAEALARQESERQAALERARAAELARKLTAITEGVAGWRLARDVRDYVAAMKAAAEAAGLDTGPESELGKEFAFALAHADEVDPVKRLTSGHAGRCDDCGEPRTQAAVVRTSPKDLPSKVRRGHT